MERTKRKKNGMEDINLRIGTGEMDEPLGEVDRLSQTSGLQIYVVYRS